MIVNNVSIKIVKVTIDIFEEIIAYKMFSESAYSEMF